MNISLDPEGKVAELRARLRERFPQAHAAGPVAPVFATGVPGLDRWEVRQGQVVEVVVASGPAGGGVLLHEVLAAGGRAGRLTALIDGRDSFDPQSAEPAALRDLLWLRCAGVDQAFQAADLLLRDGNLPLVVLDLQSTARRDLERFPGTAWSRLGLLAEKTGAILLAFTPQRLISCASLRLHLLPSFEASAYESPRAELVPRLHFQLERTRTAAAGPAVVGNPSFRRAG